MGPVYGALPLREDLWSEDATHTLIEAWGERYIAVNRGNLRQNQWQEIADAVNNYVSSCRSRKVIVTTKETPRTDVQCKNRIDTLKKKYKTEKARVLDSNGAYISQWPFFESLDDLLRTSFQANSTPSTDRSPLRAAWSFSPVPVGPRSATKKRTAPTKIPAGCADDGSLFLRNFSTFSAFASAAIEAEGSDGWRSRTGSRRKEKTLGTGNCKKDGYGELAEAIEKLGDMYERVEREKQRQMIELEKHRMLFAKELEVHRMQLFVDAQVQFQKIKRHKRDNGVAELLYPWQML
ncbi:hypothetical protein HS088_TW17G00070 [Tripterygium wilfordii]|uniref:Myb/SANT-like DNA-binding domain-containing protein n=1 Tax=Tripterygium wilfordii TaxID=458696 RepID=A0A7J7CEI8_TRIWF|nr:trihelix transcription factor ASIL1-like isoform X2 [Tripterygium wilfordii]KAF5732543.1 hypothetical protein HS088_TW17G00070 [Tripterygium wilfordii]